MHEPQWRDVQIDRLRTVSRGHDSGRNVHRDDGGAGGVRDRGILLALDLHLDFRAGTRFHHRVALTPQGQSEERDLVARDRRDERELRNSLGGRRILAHPLIRSVTAQLRDSPDARRDARLARGADPQPRLRRLAELDARRIGSDRHRGEEQGDHGVCFRQWMAKSRIRGGGSTQRTLRVSSWPLASRSATSTSRPSAAWATGTRNRPSGATSAATPSTLISVPGGATPSIVAHTPSVAAAAFGLLTAAFVIDQPARQSAR